MNDLVLKLESEAREFADADPIAGYEIKIWQNIYRKKFAELIVKECAYLVNDYQRKTGYTDHAKMLCNEFNIEYKDEDYYGRKD